MSAVAKKAKSSGEDIPVAVGGSSAPQSEVPASGPINDPASDRAGPNLSSGVGARKEVPTRDNTKGQPVPLHAFDEQDSSPSGRGRGHH